MCYVRCVRIVCPICHKTLDDVPDDYPPRPFCSPQCKLVDLHKWLNEEYRISTPLEAGEDDTSWQ